MRQGVAGVSIILAAIVPLFMLVFMTMPMDHGMSSCPFMPGEMSVCPMNILDHLSSWEEIFTSSLAEMLSFIVVVIATIGIWFVAREPEGPPGYHRRYPIPPLFQQLFSSGILNPKNP